MMCACCASAAPDAEALSGSDALRKVDDEDLLQQVPAVQAKAAAQAQEAKLAEEEEAKKKAKEEEDAAAKEKKAEEDVVQLKAPEEAAYASDIAQVGSSRNELVVQVTMDNQRTPLGMVLQQDDRVLISIQDKSLIARHNAMDTSEKVLPGYRLMSFNGCEPAKCVPEIQSAYKNPSTGAIMEFKFSRDLKPGEFVVEVSMGFQRSSVGLEMKQYEVMRITPGSLIAAHNASGTGEEVKAGDRLLSFNGHAQNQSVQAIINAYKRDLPKGFTMAFKFERPSAKK
eukprot:TRINITY_DN76218_c0_g1_i1.p1 TRINITY_DN76218_c0_g1~~TRINITY_DN76218_c0_g1_i1.p1  ORF type:complete len:300 (-),score=81.02 TRINITY_DN76218_c0_g1_i1:100-951(-)